jgi:hypothetical protein
MGAKVGYDLNLFNILVKSEAPRSTSALAKMTGADVELLSMYRLTIDSKTNLEKHGCSNS